MQVTETHVTFDDCNGELYRLFKMRHADLLAATKAKGENRMTRQAAHIQLAKLKAAIDIFTELRTAGGPAAQITRRPRMVKTVL